MLNFTESQGKVRFEIFPSTFMKSEKCLKCTWHVNFFKFMSKVWSRPTFATLNTLGLRQGAKKFSVTACPLGKWKVYVPSHHQWTNYANKNYANLWYTLLQVTKGLRFQKDKNVRFISGNFISERSSWKVKTMRCVRCILINTLLRYQCLEFTKLKCTWPTFAKTIIHFSLKFRIKTFCLRSSQMIMKQNLDK